MEHGFSFNACKTKCVVFGNCQLHPQPSWCLANNKLSICDNLDYLGATLSSLDHKNSRLAACRGRYFTLQNAGMHRDSAQPSIVSYIWKTAIQPALIYASECMPLSKTHLLDMDRLQAKLVKNSLGFSKFLRSSALLNALNIKTVSKLFHVNSLKLLSKMFNNSARSRRFYSHVCKSNILSRQNDLYSRCYLFCRSQSISVYNCVVSSQYMNSIKKSVLRRPTDDGVTDSVAMLLRTFSAQDKEMIKLLLSPF